MGEKNTPPQKKERHQNILKLYSDHILTHSMLSLLTLLKHYTAVEYCEGTKLHFVYFL